MGNNYFVALVYAVLKDKGFKTDNLSVDDAIELFNEITGKKTRKKVPKKILSNSGWAAFYRKLGEMQYGADGDVIYLPNDIFTFNVGGKWLLISGTYANPIVFGAVSSAAVERELEYQRFGDDKWKNSTMKKLNK